MNISLGSSATAVSNLLNKRVDITTPKVKVVAIDDFSLGELEPAIGVEIKYVSGLEGSNIMLLKRSDVKVILDILMGSETPEEEFEMNELTISAVCEVMNQMMGAASTALSTFLGYSVNISTPQSFTLDDLEKFNRTLPGPGHPLVVVTFMLDIEDACTHEFVNVMSVDLARELLSGWQQAWGSWTRQSLPLRRPRRPPPPAPAAAARPCPRRRSGGSPGQMGSQNGACPCPRPCPPAAAAPSLSQEIQAHGSDKAPRGRPRACACHIAVQTPPVQAAPVQAAPVQAPPVQAAPVPPQPVMQVQPVMAPPEPKMINTQPIQFSFDSAEKRLGKEQADNLELILSVPLEVSVEIGRTTRKVEEILTYSKGSLVVLDKLAGDQVDLYVNGMCVAKGDVVVIDDNFGIRITEIVKTGLADLAAK